MKIFSKKQKKCKKTAGFVSRNIAFRHLSILEFRKGFEEKSSLSEERREFPDGERKHQGADEHGLGAVCSMRTGRKSTRYSAGICLYPDEV